ncbi:Ribophorin I-domain-containing protein [Gorgonomyces haynaldii]|nr:Ribophorin I-domain-containing protein [Gorgonomyces haynaldii]
MLIALGLGVFGLEFVNNNVRSTLSLETVHARMETLIEAQAVESTKFYTFAVPKQTKDKTAFVSLYYYKIETGQLKKDQTVNIAVKQVLIQVAKAFPQEIEQTAEPQYEILGNAHFLSIYPSKEQTTVFKLPTTATVSYTKQNASKSGNLITYGPFKEVEPLSEVPVYVHYKSNKQALVAKEWSKSVELACTTLKGHFSRVDYKMTEYYHGNTQVVKSLTAVFPAKATDVYFKDAVGNVSTSNFRSDTKRSILELRPRFPLYGGWRYTWFHGYTIPLDTYLKQGDQNTLSLPDIELSTGLPLEQTQSTSYRFLDTVGRPTLHLKLNNIVDEHLSKISISFKLPPYHLYRKPALLAGSVLVAVLTLSFLSSLDLSIVKDKNKEKYEKLQKFKTGVSQALAKNKSVLAKLEAGFEKFKETKNVSTYQKVYQEQKTLFDSVLEQLKHIRESTSFDKPFSSTVEQIRASLLQHFSDMARVMQARGAK